MIIIIQNSGCQSDLTLKKIVQMYEFTKKNIMFANG